MEYHTFVEIACLITRLVAINAAGEATITMEDDDSDDSGSMEGVVDADDADDSDSMSSGAVDADDAIGDGSMSGQSPGKPLADDATGVEPNGRGKSDVENEHSNEMAMDASEAQPSANDSGVVASGNSCEKGVSGEVTGAIAAHAERTVDGVAEMKDADAMAMVENGTKKHSEEEVGAIVAQAEEVTPGIIGEMEVNGKETDKDGNVTTDVIDNQAVDDGGGPVGEVEHGVGASDKRNMDKTNTGNRSVLDSGMWIWPFQHDSYDIGWFTHIDCAVKPLLTIPLPETKPWPYRARRIEKMCSMRTSSRREKWRLCTQVSCC